MATGSMSQIEGEIQGGSGSVGKEAGGSIRTNPAGRRRDDRIVGATQATRDLVAQATAAARSDLPVILIGPSGSDKDLVARAIHAWGRRSEGAFEALSCSAIPEAAPGARDLRMRRGRLPRASRRVRRRSGAGLRCDAAAGRRSTRSAPISSPPSWRRSPRRRFRREGENTVSPPRSPADRYCGHSASRAVFRELSSPHDQDRPARGTARGHPAAGRSLPAGLRRGRGCGAGRLHRRRPRLPVEREPGPATSASFASAFARRSGSRATEP